MSKLVNDNLYETRNSLIKEIASLSYAQFNNRPSPNKWSIAQVCHHLVLVEKASIKAIAWGLKELIVLKKNGKKFTLYWIERKKFKRQKSLNQMENHLKFSK